MKKTSEKPATYSIQNCNFDSRNGMDEHTALAAKTLAEAMLELAKAFNKSPLNYYTGIAISIPPKG